MKRVITLILVLVMLASILAIPAAAASIQPRYPVGFCPKCLSGNTDFLGSDSAGLLYYCPACDIEFTVPW